MYVPIHTYCLCKCIYIVYIDKTPKDIPFLSVCPKILKRYLVGGIGEYLNIILGSSIFFNCVHEYWLNHLYVFFSQFLRFRPVCSTYYVRRYALPSVLVHKKLNREVSHRSDVISLKVSLSNCSDFSLHITRVHK